MTWNDTNKEGFPRAFPWPRQSRASHSRHAGRPQSFQGPYRDQLPLPEERRALTGFLPWVPGALTNDAELTSAILRAWCNAARNTETPKLSCTFPRGIRARLAGSTTRELTARCRRIYQQGSACPCFLFWRLQM